MTCTYNEWPVRIKETSKFTAVICLLSVVERPIMARWVVGSIPRGWLIELFLVPASPPRFI